MLNLLHLHTVNQIPLQLFNSLTRKLETFQPIHAGEARVYSCGPTVYNYPHIGNMRAYVFADILGRALSFKGYRLRHVINITDVGHLSDDADAGEDKMERMAAECVQSIWHIAKHYTEAFWDDIRALNIRQPTRWTIASEFIPQMIDFAQSIAEKHCYALPSGLYFDVSTVADYGRLARQQSTQGEGRIEPVQGKRNAADFAIWRRTRPGEKRQMEWDSPWGRGAPGWHLECSVMGGHVLGFPFDIHTGGIDHREIHHPNEIAQNQAFCCSAGLAQAANSGARIWMHNNFLIDRAGKMSKSAGEFLRLQRLIDQGYHPQAYRMMCLQAHYRSELEFSWDGLGAALVRLKRLRMGVERLQALAPPAPHWGVELAPWMDRFDAAISEDLNTAIALTVLEDMVALKAADPGEKLAAIAAMDAVLGLDVCGLDRAALRIRPRAASIGEQDIEAMLLRRGQARADKDFAAADRVRQALGEQGVEVMDGDALAWEWRLGPPPPAP